MGRPDGPTGWRPVIVDWGARVVNVLLKEGVLRIAFSNFLFWILEFL